MSAKAPDIPELTDAIRLRFGQLLGWAKHGHVIIPGDLDTLCDQLIEVVNSEVANHPDELITHLLDKGVIKSAVSRSGRVVTR